jgi:putative transposase
MSSRRDRSLEPGAWPVFDAGALSAAAQPTYKARRLAVELYASGISLSHIEARSGIDRRQIYRLLEQCLASGTGRPLAAARHRTQ